MHFPFAIDFSKELEKAGLVIKNNATVTGKLITHQIIFLDEIEVFLRIVVQIDEEMIILDANAHINVISTEIRGDVRPPKEFNEKLEKVLTQGCKNLVGTELQRGIPGKPGSERN